MTQWDVVIVGAGIAGASLADAIAEQCSVLIIEAEDQPGYHATGRSVAFWTETYGGPMIQPLTTASRSFLENPPLKFSDKSFLKSRGALHIGTADMQSERINMQKQFADSGVALLSLAEADIENHITGLRKNWTQALWEPDCCDIDVARLHAAYLRSARHKKVRVECNMAMESAAYRSGAWDIETLQGSVRAKLLVNAAGAWADQVASKAAVKPLTMQPYRRTVLQLAIDPPALPNLPLTIALDGSFYFKPEPGGKIWLSPHDETPTHACDAAPDEIDIALAIDRFEAAVDWKVERLEHKWAGLRTFSPDRLPVVGRDPAVPEFFWFAGQGGFGIQTAPAMAQLAAAQILDYFDAPQQVSSEHFRPDRF